MSRSIKKGPFCAPELLKRVDEMNETEGIYTIIASTANSPVYYSTEDGKFAECQTEQTSDTFLGQFNGYYAYAVE